MKRWITLGGAAAVGLTLSSCLKTSTSSDDCAPEESHAPPSTPTPAIAAPESGPMTAVTAPPAPKRFAPEGTFFLLAKKSIETDSGILGLSPGTRVTRRPDGKFLAEGNVVELQPKEITNDLDDAARAAGADARAQAAIRQTLAARTVAGPGGTSAPGSGSTKSAAASPDSGPPASTSRAGSSLSGSAPLGSAHSMTKDGWLWQKNGDGEWERVRRLR